VFVPTSQLILSLCNYLLKMSISTIDLAVIFIVVSTATVFDATYFTFEVITHYCWCQWWVYRNDYNTQTKILYDSYITKCSHLYQRRF
jgi:hypothetical protein